MRIRRSSLSWLMPALSAVVMIAGSGSSGSASIVKELQRIAPVSCGEEDTTQNLRFGHALDMDAETAVIGAPSYPDGIGSVYVFQRNPDGTLAATCTKFESPAPQSGNNFGLQVAVDGTTIAVSGLEGPVGDRTFHVYIYERSPLGIWSLVQELSAPDNFGDGWSAIDIDGDRLAIGAFRGNGRCPGTGLVYVYQRGMDGIWVLDGPALAASDGELTDWFGISLSLDGDSLAVGAPGHGHGRGPGAPCDDPDLPVSNTSGAAYVFSRASGAWTEVAELVPGDLMTSDYFGSSVSIQGETLAVGALGANSRNTGCGGVEAVGTGVVHVFDGAGSSWTRETVLQAHDPIGVAYFGHQVAVEGDAIVVGASLSGPGSRDGAAYVFRRVASSWRQVAQLDASDSPAEAWLGNDVAIVNDTILVGAPLTPAGMSTLRGSSYLYKQLNPLDGNVDTGDGSPPAMVLYLNGSTGGQTHEVSVGAGQTVRLDVLHAPSFAPGRGHYAVWILDGDGLDCVSRDISFRDGSGQAVALGCGLRCLPINNSVSAGSCVCPSTFPRGFTSRQLSAGAAARYCLNARPGHDLAPEHFFVRFPVGEYTIGGVVLDRNAPASPETNIAVANWIIVRSRP